MRLIVACMVAATGSSFSTSPMIRSPASTFQLSAASSDFEDAPAIQEKIFDPLSNVLVTTLRVGTCALMIHHGFDKVVNVDGFSANVVAKFFGFLPGDPKFWTLSAAYTQIGGSVLLGVGVLARPVALSMCATMSVAVIFHLLNTGGEGFPLTVVPQHSYNFELAAMYVGVLAYFATAGAGAYSIDNIVLGGELNLYQSVIDKVFGGSSDDDFEEEAVVEEKKSFFGK